MIKRLTIENFESIIGKETEHLKIDEAGWDSFNDQYFFIFHIKGGSPGDNGEVVIKRTTEGYEWDGAFYLDVRWISRTNSIYTENVWGDVFKHKAAFFMKLDEIIMQRLNYKI